MITENTELTYKEIHELNELLSEKINKLSYAYELKYVTIRLLLDEYKSLYDSIHNKLCLFDAYDEDSIFYEIKSEYENDSINISELLTESEIQILNSFISSDELLKLIYS